MLQIKNVNLNVGNTALLSNINLTLEQGKIYGVLGPNGAGKTTLFKSMLGLTAFSGEILSDGQPVSSRCFGSLIEYPAFYPRLTVEENLKLHAQYLGLKRPNIEAALKQVNLLDARKKLFSQLSLGMRQRLGIARAFLGDVQYLLLDEPTNGLDPNQIRQIRELIKGLAANHTIILSTHILSEVEMICNKVIIIDQGTIKAADTPSNLTANLRAAGKITLEFRGDLALITRKLENLEHVKKVIHEGTDADGWHTLTVRAEAGTDTREKAARLLAEQGCPLRHIYRHTPTLEEVFVEMTRKD